MGHVDTMSYGRVEPGGAGRRLNCLLLSWDNHPVPWGSANRQGFGSDLLVPSRDSAGHRQQYMASSISANRIVCWYAGMSGINPCCPFLAPTSAQGFDLDLVGAVSRAVTIPVIASSGAGAPEHFSQVGRGARAGGVHKQVGSTSRRWAGVHGQVGRGARASASLPRTLFSEPCQLPIRARWL